MARAGRNLTKGRKAAPQHSGRSDPMNKKISISLAITIAIIAMTVTFSVTMVLAGQRFNNTVC